MTLSEKISGIEQQWQPEVERQKVSEAQLLEMEQAAKEFGNRIAQAALESLLEKAGKGYRGASLDCECGGKLKFQRYVRRQVRSLVGPVSYERAYYYCRQCQASRSPLDEKLGQSEREISAGVERKVARLSAEMSFGAVENVLEEFGIEISDRQIETVAEQVGDRAEQLSLVEAQAAQTQDLAPRPRLRLVGAPDSPAVAVPTRTWIVEMDGVMAGLKSGAWQEVKVGAIYELGSRVEISKDRWELLNKQRCVTRWQVEEFRRHLWALLVGSGARVSDRIVVLGDGAEWIAQTVAELFPQATQILDFYHVSERVWEVANQRYGEQTSAGRAWAEEKLGALKEGRVGGVLSAMRRLEMPSVEARQVRADAVRYFERHRHLMAYDKYRAENLPIGSGAIEGSCKHLVAARCKQSGMRWTPEGLGDILALRCWVLNDRLDELCPKPKVKIEWAKAA